MCARVESSNFLGCHVRASVNFANITEHRAPISQLNVRLYVYIYICPLCIETQDLLYVHGRTDIVWVSQQHRDSRFTRIFPSLGTILNITATGLSIRFQFCDDAGNTNYACVSSSAIRIQRRVISLSKCPVKDYSSIPFQII